MLSIFARPVDPGGGCSTRCRRAENEIHAADTRRRRFAGAERRRPARIEVSTGHYREIAPAAIQGGSQAAYQQRDQRACQAWQADVTMLPLRTLAQLGVSWSRRKIGRGISLRTGSVGQDGTIESAAREMAAQPKPRTPGLDELVIYRRAVTPVVGTRRSHPCRTSVR